jgi:hypothetical protein
MMKVLRHCVIGAFLLVLAYSPVTQAAVPDLNAFLSNWNCDSPPHFWTYNGCTDGEWTSFCQNVDPGLQYDFCFDFAQECEDYCWDTFAENAAWGTGESACTVWPEVFDHLQCTCAVFCPE